MDLDRRRQCETTFAPHITEFFSGSYARKRREIRKKSGAVKAHALAVPPFPAFHKNTQRGPSQGTFRRSAQRTWLVRQKADTRLERPLPQGAAERCGGRTSDGSSLRIATVGRVFTGGMGAPRTAAAGECSVRPVGCKSGEPLHEADTLRDACSTRRVSKKGGVKSKRRDAFPSYIVF